MSSFGVKLVNRSALWRPNRFRVISKTGLTLLAGIIVSLASFSLITHVASAQFAPIENLIFGSPYGWYDGGKTVEVNVTNRGLTNVTIAATRINGVDCPTFNGSNGLELYPGNSTILTITYQNNVFQPGVIYTIEVVTAGNNVFPTMASLDDVPEFPPSFLLSLSIIATLLTITIYKRKHSSFLTR
jgi:hypothetical protein